MVSGPGRDVDVWVLLYSVESSMNNNHKVMPNTLISSINQNRLICLWHCAQYKSDFFGTVKFCRILWASDTILCTMCVLYPVTLQCEHFCIISCNPLFRFLGLNSVYFE